jgi:hypothetical protein
MEYMLGIKVHVLSIVSTCTRTDVAYATYHLIFLCVCVYFYVLGMRGEMSDRREKLIRMAFSWLDKDRSVRYDLNVLSSFTSCN